jgi:hypothetical protein
MQIPSLNKDVIFVDDRVTSIKRYNGRIKASKQSANQKYHLHTKQEDTFFEKENYGKVIDLLL